ncbi:hypothetical protein [Natronobacterium texcoconense]|uniref:Uncharacterized protein n=1 Tax=Natronobacterium texcoconense TaxID=1095778 RepID=A0A1H1GV19_NATTX|nr:hypothetical protein [Natronobacterium texcoconense]SDR17020.1 hypothetical protein SAMN04489842_2627 [Natronobacterium texcoconense]
MKRRALLATTGPAVLGSIAGCADFVSSVEPSAASGDTDDRDAVDDSDLEFEIPESPDDVPINDFGNQEISDFSGAETREEIEIGSGDGVDEKYGPHTVLVSNFGSDPELEIGVIDVLSKTVVHGNRHRIPDDERLAIELLTPSKYVVNVRSPESELEHAVRVPCWAFDCNLSSTSIGVFDDDEIASYLMTNLAGCGNYSC